MNFFTRFITAFTKRAKRAGRTNVPRRTERSKKKLRDGRKLRRRGSPIIRITSRLEIKRRADADHLRARLYKRTMSGVCGRLSWKDLDRIFAAAKFRKKKPAGKSASGGIIKGTMNVLRKVIGPTEKELGNA